MLRHAFIAFSFLLLSACTPTLGARVVGYHDGLELRPGKSFAVVAQDGQENDLEFRHYAEIVNRHLHAQGLVQAVSLNRADYRVQFRYGIDGGRQQVVSYPARGYGGMSTFYGSGGYTGIGMGYTMPYHGSRVESYTTYTRLFELQILRNKGVRDTVYQGRVVSTGENASFSSVAPCMIAALFQNFPGPNGQEMIVRLPLASCSP